MNMIKNLVEYYDELFPITEEQEVFFEQLINEYITPAKILRISCGTGLFEHKLSKKGHDVTGIESCSELLEVANLRRRSQLMSLRFFQMTADEMNKFLGKGFYNIISILDSRICFFKDKEEVKNLINGCKNLLSENGALVINVLNFEKFRSEPVQHLPEYQSIRCKLFSELWSKNGNKTLSQHIENGSGKIIPVLKDIPVIPVMPKDIEDYAAAAGFHSAEFYSDYKKSPFTGKEDSFVVIIK